MVYGRCSQFFAAKKGRWRFSLLIFHSSLDGHSHPIGSLWLGSQRILAPNVVGTVDVTVRLLEVDCHLVGVPLHSARLVEGNIVVVAVEDDFVALFLFRLVDQRCNHLLSKASPRKVVGHNDILDVTDLPAVVNILQLNKQRRGARKLPVAHADKRAHVRIRFTGVKLLFELLARDRTHCRQTRKQLKKAVSEVTLLELPERQ